MNISGEHLIPATRERVWQALNDIDVLRACIPGCEEVVRISDRDLSVRVLVRVGAVKACFSGRVLLSDLDPPGSCTLSGQGQGGAAGFAKGAANVTLSAHGVDTLLAYDARVDVGGKLASIGSRLLQGVATTTVEEFFSRLNGCVAGGQQHRAAGPAVLTGEAMLTPVGGPPRDAAPPARLSQGEAPAIAPLIAAPVSIEPERAPPGSADEGRSTAHKVIVAGGVAFYLLILLALFA